MRLGLLGLSPPHSYLLERNKKLHESASRTKLENGWYTAWAAGTGSLGACSLVHPQEFPAPCRPPRHPPHPLPPIQSHSPCTPPPPPWALPSLLPPPPYACFAGPSGLLKDQVALLERRVAVLRRPQSGATGAVPGSPAPTVGGPTGPRGSPHTRDPPAQDWESTHASVHPAPGGGPSDGGAWGSGVPPSAASGRAEGVAGRASLGGGGGARASRGQGAVGGEVGAAGDWAHPPGTAGAGGRGRQRLLRRIASANVSLGPGGGGGGLIGGGGGGGGGGGTQGSSDRDGGLGPLPGGSEVGGAVRRASALAGGRALGTSTGAESGGGGGGGGRQLPSGRALEVHGRVSVGTAPETALSALGAAVLASERRVHATTVSSVAGWRSR